MAAKDTIKDGDWKRLQRAAASAAGGLVKNASQQKKAQTWSQQRDNARKN